jgi:hypothetical protein
MTKRMSQRMNFAIFGFPPQPLESGFSSERLIFKFLLKYTNEKPFLFTGLIRSLETPDRANRLPRAFV